MKPSAVIAFCPGHISGYFKKISGDTLASTGSIGAGVVISEGVTSTVRPSDKTSISIRQKRSIGPSFEIASGSPLLTSVMEEMDIPAAVITECALPIGAGFGLSAAALLATLTAANRLFDRGMSPREIAQCAHAAEVTHRTGLGDVAACQAGGWVIRSGPGIGGRIERRYDMTEPLYALSFGPIPTPAVLGSPALLEQVSSAFPKTMPKDIEDFFLLSRQFSEQSGLITPQVKSITRLCDAAGVPSAMTMLGNGVFAYGRKAQDLLRPFGHVYEFHVAGTGVHIVEDSA
jgi:pantoate kinase